jgi:hypothetical protein
MRTKNPLPLPSALGFLPDVDHWFAFVEAMCSFAYACGIVAADAGLPRQAPHFLDPHVMLAWEAGYDDAARNWS